MKTLFLIAVTMVLVTIVAWLLGVDPLRAGDWSGQANEAIRPWRTRLMIGRWGLWCVLWWRWEWVGQHLFKAEAGDNTAQRAQWSRMRNRMMGGITVVEAIILFSAISGSHAWV